MSVLGSLANLLDTFMTGRPPRVIDRQFGWLRDLGFAVEESGWRAMELYATYASTQILVRVKNEFHYGFVGVWLARRGVGGSDAVGPDVDLEQLLAHRGPAVQWDPNYDTSVPGAAEAKLAEAARLLRDHCGDLLRGENLSVL